MLEDETFVSTPRVQTVVTQSFSALASVGVNARFRETSAGIRITRSPWDLVVVLAALVGFGVVPVFLLGAEELRALLSGDLSGDRWFVVIVTPICALLGVLYVRSWVIRRPVALVSPVSNSIDYVHPGYDQQSIAASDVRFVSVEARGGTMAASPHQRTVAYAVTLTREDGSELDVATHRAEGRMRALATAIARTLDISLESPRSRW